MEKNEMRELLKASLNEMLEDKSTQVKVIEA
jgi:hypothetical protein